jgi:hypothetical protein
MTAPLGVPVFNCVVNVAPPTAEGIVVATAANLAGIAAQGKSEREALAAVVAQFKAAMSRYHASGAAIPWLEPPAPPGRGEVQRLIAVHL